MLLLIIGVSVLAPLTALAEEEYYAVYRVEWRSDEGDYIIGKIRVTFNQGYSGIYTSYKVLEVEEYSGDTGGFSPEDALDFIVSTDKMVFEFYSDPQDLGDGHVYNEINLGNKTLVIDLTYDINTGVLQNAYLATKTATGETGGYTKYTLLETNVKLGSLNPESTETQAEEATYSETYTEATQSTPGTVQQETSVKEGDWATYRISFDISSSKGEYARGSATFKVVFHGTYYDITDVKVESLDTNTENVSESDVESFVRTISFISPFLISKENLTSNGVLEGQRSGVSYRLEYDPSTGILKSASVKIESDEGSGTITIGMLDTSVKGVAAPSETPSPIGGVGTGSGGLGGLTTIIIIIVVIAAAAIVGIVVFLKKRKPKAAPYPYTPPPPPPPPPQ